MLTQLQQAHLLNIPFENLDIHDGVPIELDIGCIYSKVVLNRRGGFCYELNGLFYELLLKVGFRAKRIAARVFDKDIGYGPPFDHMAIIVSIDGIDYLSDVGFGEFSFSPLQMMEGVMQQDARGVFIMEPHDNGYTRVSKLENNLLVPQYIFTTTGTQLDEFKEMCLYHQTSPQSHFTKQALITRPTQEGRITLTRDKLKIKEGDATCETPLDNEEAFRQMLSKYFAIDLISEKKVSETDQGHKAL